MKLPLAQSAPPYFRLTTASNIGAILLVMVFSTACAAVQETSGGRPLTRSSARLSSRSTVSPLVRHVSLPDRASGSAQPMGHRERNPMDQSNSSLVRPRSVESARINEALPPFPSPRGTAPTRPAARRVNYLTDLAEDMQPITDLHFFQLTQIIVEFC